MKAYAIANLQHLDMGPPIVEYLQRVDATLEPFGGRFLVHGGAKTVLEGKLPGFPIVVEFPDIDHARGWYASRAYQDILHLRTDNSEGVAVLVEGVGPNHKATDVLHPPSGGS
jgi:uncharacterized protein (DUF1330 family)